MDGQKKRGPLRIIRACAPVRINDIGGWTDTWFAGEGKVLNLAVSPLVEVEIKVFENPLEREDRVRVHAVNYDTTFRVHPENPSYDEQPLLEGAVASIPVPEQVELDITVQSHVPGGSSTGSSASVCVAVLGALGLLADRKLSKKHIARLAQSVETDKLGLQCGIQDQICAAHGGISFIHMTDYPEAEVQRVQLGDGLAGELDRRLALIYLGSSHSSSALHEKVIALLEEKGGRFKILGELKDLAEEARTHLLAGDLKAFGDVMVRNNECQRSLHPELISREADQVISIARKHGAEGWKVNGAGGAGGTVTLLAGPGGKRKKEMIQEMEQLGEGMTSIPVSLDMNGLVVRDLG